MVQAEIVRGGLKGVAISRHSPQVSHLLFVDDTIIFGHSTGEAMGSLKCVMKLYGLVCGQEINMEISSMVVSRNVEEAQRVRLASLLGVQLVIKHDKDLGLPAVVGKSSGELFQSVRDRVWNRVQGWNSKLLSQARKAVLIKSVIQSIPTYVMSCFRLPEYVVHELEAMIADFWWHNQGERRTHWVGWGKLCETREVGGLGFQDLGAFNAALLAKQGWRLLTRPNSLLGQLFKAKYYPRSSFLEAAIGNRPSLTWRSILAARDLVISVSQWHIGSGSKIHIWVDLWVPRPTEFKPITPPTILSCNALVAELIDEDTGEWKADLITQIFGVEEARVIMDIPIGGGTTEDTLVWHYGQYGQFTVRSAYQLQTAKGCRSVASTSGTSGRHEHQTVERSWKRIWNGHTPLKVRTFIWRACHEAVPTTVNLARRMGSTAESCALCASAAETMLHVLLQCSFARQMWALSQLPWRIISETTNSDREWIRHTYESLGLEKGDRFLVICWGLWHQRNQVVMEGSCPAALEVVRRAMRFQQEYAAALQSVKVRVAN